MVFRGGLMASALYTCLFNLVSFILFSSNALACAVCMGGIPKETLNAYLEMTLVLSLIPIGMVLFGIYYYKKHSENKNKAAEP